MLSTFNSNHTSIQQLVEIMMQDELMLTEWYQLSFKLDSSSEQRVKWRAEILKQNAHYKVFLEILTEWVLKSEDSKTVHDLCLILEDMECIQLKEKLQEKFGGSKIQIQKASIMHKIELPLVYGLTPPIKNFTGRVQELDKLQSFYKNKNRLLLICGLEGIGKTELCRKFAHTVLQFSKVKPLKKIHSYKKTVSCIWLSGDTPESLNNSVHNLLTNLGMPSLDVSNTYSEQLLLIVKKILEQVNAHLIIFIDNVDNKYEEVERLVNKLKNRQRIFIVVITRNKNLLGKKVNTNVLYALKETDTTGMIQEFQKPTKFEPDSICTLLQNYPLALQLAVNYIKEQRKHTLSKNYSISYYVREFQLKKTQILSQSLKEFKHDYEMTISIVLEITLEQFTTDTKDVLEVLAFLHPHDVHVEFLEEICNELGLRDECFEKALNLLTKYFVVQKIEVGIGVSVHRVIQKFIRDKTVDREFPKNLFEIVLSICARKFLKKKLKTYETLHFMEVCKHLYGTFVYTEHLFPKSNEVGNNNNNGFKFLIKAKLAYELHKKGKQAESIDLCKEILMRSKDHSKNVYTTLLLIFEIHNPPKNDDSTNDVSTMLKLLNTLTSKVSKENNTRLETSSIEQIELQEYCLNDKERDATDIKINNLSSSELIDYKIKLAVSLEKIGEKEVASNLLKQVRKNYFRIPPCNKNDLKIIQIRTEDWVKLTSVEIHVEYSKFDYNRLDLLDLERILLNYKIILGKTDKLTLRLKNVLAAQFCRSGKYKEALNLVEDVLNSLCYLEYNQAYNTMYEIACCFYITANYLQASVLYERVLQFRRNEGHKGELEASLTRKLLRKTNHELGFKESGI